MISICFREDRLGSKMAERKRAQAAKAMEKKTMNPKVIESKYNHVNFPKSQSATKYANSKM